MTMAIHVLIPAYQPSKVLSRIVRELSAYGFDVLLIDDGSQGCDDIFNAAEKTDGVKVVHHECNMGKGQALKTGLAYLAAAFSTSDVVVTADADGQHAPADIAAVAAEAVKCPGSLVLGVRDVEQMPGRSRLGNTVMRVGMDILYGVRVKDTQTGLRAFSLAEVSQVTALPEGGYAFETAMLINASQIFPAGIRQVGIETIYEDGNSTSHYNALFDSARILASMVRHLPRFLVASVSSFALDYLLFSLLYTLGGLGVVPSTVFARVVSAAYNFLLNKHYVFAGRGVRYTFGRYALLAVCILTVNSTLMYLFADVLGLPAMAMKVVVECLMYVASFTVQTRWAKTGS